MQIQSTQSNETPYLLTVFTFITFLVTVIVNGTMGMKSKPISNKFSLNVTPPSKFFSIWGVIYFGLLIVLIYNLVINQWTQACHFWFICSCLLNSGWVLVFRGGTIRTITICSGILMMLVPTLLVLWIELGKVDSIDIWLYLTRNVFAFYLGWVIAATNLNAGMVMVYRFKISQEKYTLIFWIVAPLCAIITVIFIAIVYGKTGIFSSLALWLSVGWAFLGAFISTKKHLKQS